MPKPTASQVHVNVPLTNISIAYIQAAENFIADRVFPNIPVTKQSDRYFTYSKADWFRIQADERAPSTESAGGGYNIDNTPTYYARLYALHKDIDDQIRANADAPINMDRDATEYLTQNLLMKRDKLWALSHFKVGVWGVDKTGGVDFTQWDNALSTPIEDITNAGITMASTTGFRPNTLVLSPFVFNALKNNADVLDRIKYTQRGVITSDILAGLFEVDRVLVPYGVENTAAEGVAGAYDFIFGKNALLCYVNPRPSILTPSAGYTFSWTGLLGAGAAGNRIKTFRMDKLASDRVEAEMAFDQKQVAADLGVFFSAAVS